MNELHSKARILITDDDEDDFIITSEYIRAIPGNSFTIDWASTYNKGLQQLADNSYDLYFVDYRLGAKSGVDFLKAAKQMQSEAPIVLLTGKGNYAVDLEAMELGAVDYLVKSELNVEKTERCIRYALDRANTLKALRRSENKYRGIFEKSKDIVFVMDTAFVLGNVNDAVLPMLGFTKDEMCGRNLLELVCRDEDRISLEKGLNEGTIQDKEVLLLTKYGTKLHCTITATVENPESEEEYVQGIIHDISNLKKAEKESLLNEKLAATSRLVRTLAHEIRNPLNNIAMSVEQLKMDAPDEHSQMYLDIVDRNATRINGLLTELLNSSNPKDNAHLPQHMQEIMDEVMMMATDRLTLKRIRAELHYPSVGIAIRVLADRENLKLALLNIVINAIEAMEEDTGVLTVGIHNTRNHAVLTITDNGCGISDEYINRIFDPYFTRKRNGSGLGLAFTLNILKTHQANIEVSSTPGMGTTFNVLFPLA